MVVTARKVPFEKNFFVCDQQAIQIEYDVELEIPPFLPILIAF